MKKLLALLLALAMVFSMAACTGGSSNEGGGGGEEEVFLKKGTFDFAAAMDEFNATQQGAVSGDAATPVDGEDIALEEETVEAQ